MTNKKMIALISMLFFATSVIADTTIDVQKDRRSQMTIDLGQVIVEAIANIEKSGRSSILAPEKKRLSKDNEEILRRFRIRKKLRSEGFYPREWEALYKIPDSSIFEGGVQKINYKKAIASAGGKWKSVSEMITECQTVTGKGYADMVFMKRDIESLATQPMGGVTHAGWTDVLIDSGYQAFRKTVKGSSTGITKKGWNKVKKMVQCWAGTAHAARLAGEKLANKRYKSRGDAVNTAITTLRNMDIKYIQNEADTLVKRVKKCRLPSAADHSEKYQITCGALRIDFDTRAATYSGGTLLSSEGSIGTRYTAEISGGESRRSTFQE